MVDVKTRLMIKLVIYALEKTRQFIFRVYDQQLAEDISFCKKENENHQMIWFMLFTFDFSLEKNVNNEFKNRVDEIIEKSRAIETTVDMFNFAKNDIPYFIDNLEKLLP
ncbi:hypothetical protein [Streptococcus sp. zg-JUN1979]|uniref:hypothetical protein n=1 Tax=Streptococcus sp. zg-JUN1979 TaxID=3391450 RepID=UPI0039A5C32D